MTLPKRWKPVIEEPALPPRVPPRVLVAGLVAVSLPGLSGAEGSKGTMYHTCPFCGVGLLGVVEQTWERVPLYEDGFDPSEGGPAVNEIVSVSCPRCKWGGDARYYEAGVLSVQVPVHFHVGAAAGTTGEVYEEYTAHYVAPPSEGDSPTWLLSDWEGEPEVGPVSHAPGGGARGPPLAAGGTGGGDRADLWGRRSSRCHLATGVGVTGATDELNPVGRRGGRR